MLPLLYCCAVYCSHPKLYNSTGLNPSSSHSSSQTRSSAILDAARFARSVCRCVAAHVVASQHCPTMARFVRSSALTAVQQTLRPNSLPASLLSLAPRHCRASLLSSLSSPPSPVHLFSVRSAATGHEMARPSASSPPSSLKPARQSAAAPAQQVTNPKQTTWITGLPVVPNAREVLLSLYEETLRKVASYDVKDPYNAHLVQLVKYRQAIVQRESDVDAIEKAIGSGQIEELIEDAEDEFDLLVAMNETIRPWEADEEGDAAFKDYHPSFGQEKKHFVIEPTADEQKAFDALGEQQQQQQQPSSGSGAGAAATQPSAASAATATKA